MGAGKGEGRRGKGQKGIPGRQWMEGVWVVGSEGKEDRK
jgi:hypothetical protein